MFKKIIYLFLTITSISLSTVNADVPAQVKPIQCSPQLKKHLNMILTIPEARALIAAIQSEGNFSIVTNNHQLSKQFGAFWDMTNRKICISLTSNCSEGEILGSILFELQNAAVNSKLEQLDYLAATRRIKKEAYVQQVERLEYENSKKAVVLAKKGIELGILPKNACLPTYNSFEEHYRFQKIGGHSEVIGKNYDQLMTTSF